MGKEEFWGGKAESDVRSGMMVFGAGGTAPALEGWRGEEHGQGWWWRFIANKSSAQVQKHFQIQDGPRMNVWRGEDGKVSGLKMRIGPRRRSGLSFAFVC